MALVKCRECGQRISDQALACPHCGAPASVPKRALVAAVVAGLLAAVLGGVLFVSRASDGGGSGDPAPMGGIAISIGAVLVGLAVVLLLVRLRGRSG